MCLILLSYHSHSHYRLVMAANRDEFYDRPTAPADFWEDEPNVLAGRDLKYGGTWLGITKTGRLAALTNFRNPASRKNCALSRGHLVSDFLTCMDKPFKYYQALVTKANNYNDFSLLFGNQNQIHFMSSQSGQFLNLTAGTYGLSNHLLNTPWPKVKRGRDALRHIISNGGEICPEAIFEILTDQKCPDDELLPDTGLGLEWERILAPIFITSSVYGTRSSTVLLIDSENKVTFIERSYHDRDPGQSTEKKFDFQLNSITQPTTYS